MHSTKSPIFGSGCTSVTPRGFADLTDETLADEDTNSTLTDNVNRTFQANVAMQVTQPGGQLWNQTMQVPPPDDKNLAKLELMQVAPSGGQICS